MELISALKIFSLLIKFSLHSKIISMKTIVHTLENTALENQDILESRFSDESRNRSNFPPIFPSACFHLWVSYHYMTSRFLHWSVLDTVVHPTNILSICSQLNTLTEFNPEFFRTFSGNFINFLSSIFKCQ